MLKLCQIFRVYYCTNSKIDLNKLLKEVTREKFEIKYIRSSGPGGQNVNKLNTKVLLKLNLPRASWIPQDVMAKMREQAKSSINKDDTLFVTSEKTRSQYENLEDAMKKVRGMLTAAAYVPKETSEEQKQIVQEHKEKFNDRRKELKNFRAKKKADRKLFD